jgi:hypothetical protein
MKNHYLSGSSIQQFASILYNIINYQPLSPLTGDDDEWYEMVDFLSNKRCNSVIKTKEGVTIDLGGEMYIYNNGTKLIEYPHNPQEIRFPYMPHVKTTYLDSDE